MKKILAIATLMIGLWTGSALKCGFPCVVGGIPSFEDILGLGGLPQASWLDCNATCLLAAIGNTTGRVFKFNENYCTLIEVLDENGYDDVLSGLGKVECLSSMRLIVHSQR